MTTYADDIEEANDSTARKALLEALFGKTKLAAPMAATEGDTPRQPETQSDAEILVCLFRTTKGNRTPQPWADHQIATLAVMGE